MELLGLWLLMAAVLTPSTAAVVASTSEPTPVCERDETEAIVALMASLLVDPDCLGVADDKCPSDANCLGRLVRIINKMPDCVSSANNAHKSQRARLQLLVESCKVPVATTTTNTTTSRSATGNEPYVNETSVRSTASAASALTSSIATCCIGVALSAVCTAALVWN
ncbi:Elicitin [Globisporangium polare]